MLDRQQKAAIIGIQHAFNTAPTPLQHNINTHEKNGGALFKKNCTFKHSTPAGLSGKRLSQRSVEKFLCQNTQKRLKTRYTG
jgi:hypothetical protein